LLPRDFFISVTPSNSESLVYPAHSNLLGLHWI
jgi:hypothetical protein